MQVRALQKIGDRYKADEVVDIDDALAMRWLDRGIAEVVEAPAPVAAAEAPAEPARQPKNSRRGGG